MNDTVSLRDEPVKVPIVSSETVFAGHIYDVVREVFEYNGELLSREFVRHPGAVAVLAVDSDNRVLVINQYRHPLRSREWEIPAGLLDVSGEPLLAAAQRELAEEADLEASSWAVLSEVFTSPGGSDEYVRIYLARGLRPTVAVYDREDEEADIEIRWLPLDDVVAAVISGSVRNAILVTAILAAHASRENDWAQLGRA